MQKDEKNSILQLVKKTNVAIDLNMFSLAGPGSAGL